MKCQSRKVIFLPQKKAKARTFLKNLSTRKKPLPFLVFCTVSVLCIYGCKLLNMTPFTRPILANFLQCATKLKRIMKLFQAKVSQNCAAKFHLSKSQECTNILLVVYNGLSGAGSSRSAAPCGASQAPAELVTKLDLARKPKYINYKILPACSEL